ncbi:MAG: hypothetical protein IT559_04125 [Alphaproteobacteria bacterium]|nr:hypothetical protein [Alphaproteobacteria bacterium]
MNWLLFGLAALPAFPGLYCLFDFFTVQATGKIAEAEVVDFSTKKDKGRFLPIVERAAAGDQPAEMFEPQKIDQISYLLSPSIKKENINIVVLRNGMVRVHGYLKLLGGILLILPVLAVLGSGQGGSFFTGQMAFVFLLIAVSVGGWALLRTIARLR